MVKTRRTEWGADAAVLQSYRSLVERHRAAAFALDASGRTVAVNEASARVTGRTREELRGTRLGDVVVAEDRPRAVAALRAALVGEATELGLTVVHRDGGHRLLEVAVVPIECEGRTAGVLGVATDVTEREEALRALRVSEEHHRSILERIADGYFECDLDGRFRLVNDSLCRMVGAPREEVLGRRFDDCMDEANRAVLGGRLRRLLETGEPEPGVVFWYHRDDGALRAGSASATLVTDADGEPVGFRGVMRDVTHQQRSEEALERSEERYRLISRATQEILWDADLVAGTTVWTGALRQVLGIDADTLRFDEAWWQDRVHPADWEQMSTSTHAALSDPTALWQGEYRLRREDGGYATIFARGHVVHDETGRPVRLVGSMMDITERTRREQELLAARREADEASQAKSQFLANMSHELRTPMNGVIGMVDLLLETPLDPTQRRYAETVRQSGERLLVIINDILDISKIEAGKIRLEPRPFALADVVGRTVAPLAADVRRKGLRLTTHLGEGVDQDFEGDPERIGQILTNLLGNAVKFTESGQVALHVERVVGGSGADAVRFRVEDTGIGLTRDQLQRLFRPFSQADASTTKRYGGTGLGLAITRELVRLMDGRIDVRSTYGVGSTFEVEVPLRPLGPAPAPAAAGRVVAPVAAGQRVLLVEDNDVNQDVATLMLTRLGYEVDVAADGRLALEALARRRYAAVLMDVQMPNLDGYAATRLFREREARRGSARTPVIAMTANALHGDRERALAAGMDDHLPKPVRLEELAAALDRWVVPPVPESGPVVELDQEALRGLASIGPECRTELLATFRADAVATADALGRAHRDGDGRAVAELAEHLRSSSAGMAAVGLGRLLGEVERLVEAGDLAAAAPLVARLSGGLPALLAVLEEELSPDGRPCAR